MTSTAHRPLCVLGLVVVAYIIVSSESIDRARDAEDTQRSFAIRRLQAQNGSDINVADGLNSAEINAIIEKLQQADPEAFVGRNVAELCQELASSNLTVVVEDSSAPTDLQAVTTELLAGLDATPGAPGQPAPAPPEVAVNITPFSPPEDCPGWGCVCADKPANTKVAAPDFCQAFVTCDGNGSGAKTLCPIAGTGFSPASGTCQVLDGPPEAGDKCNFADSSVGTASTAQDSSDATTYTCAALLSSKATTNIVASVEAGVEGCAPQNPRKPARVEIRASNASMMITTVLVKYLERGPTTTLTIASARGAANITSFRVHRRVVNHTATSIMTTAALLQADLWQPRTALVPFTRPAGAVVLTVAAARPAASILLLSVDVTEALLPSRELQLSSLAAAPVAPRSSAQNGMGVEVPIIAGAKANYGVASDPDDGVAAQGILNALNILGRQQWWQHVDTANKVVGLLNFADNAGTWLANMMNYVKAYQNVLLGSSQCWRHSYGRGVGTIPTNCHSWENIAGICYERCRHNYHPVWFVCWEHCPGGFQDHGITCHRPMHSYWNDNKGWCGWWNICALWSRTDCRSCDHGYHRHGCICTRPPVWHGKHTYTRSAVLPDCWPDREKQTGLCYTPCGEGYWGEGPVCYNECPDAFPHSCGIGACAKNGDACARLVKNAVIAVIDLAVSAVSALAGGPLAIAGALAAIGNTGYVFGSTRACGDQRVHLRSRLAILTVHDREFHGEHIQVFDHIDWDGCLIRCRQNGNCKGVIFNRNMGRCHLLGRVGEGPHGRTAHAPGIDTAVAIMRMPPESASWQFTVGHNITLRGTPLSVTPGYAIEHHNNLAFCQLSCVEKDCDFIAFSSRFCIVMNRFGPQVQGLYMVDPRSIHGTSAAPVHSVMINMAKWNDWDAGGNYPTGI